MKEKQVIYVVDDREESALLLSDLLTLVGYKVYIFGGGPQILKVLNDKSNPLPHPDLILLDLMMPEMDGIEVVQRIKAIEYLPYIPIIIITARTEINDKVVGLQVGADDFLSKPINRAELLARVRSLLRLKQSLDSQIQLLKEKEVAYQQLSNAQVELIKAEKRKAQMDGMLATAGAICHEMSQPLTSAMVTLQLVMQDLDQENVQQISDLQSIEDGLLKARTILEKLRALTDFKTKPYIGDEHILDLDKSANTDEEENLAQIIIPDETEIIKNRG
jgi:two-component system, sensor histidine kinase and response regulator